jgi:adenylate cyclase
MKFSVKSYITCVISWMLADALFVLIRFVGLDTVPVFATLDYDSFNHVLFFSRCVITGIVIGSIFYFVSRSFEKPAIRRRPYGVMIAIQALVSVFFVLILLIVQRAREMILLDKEFSIEFFASRIFTVNFLVILTYYSIVSFLFVLINQIDRKFGPGNLLKLIKGTYYHPRSIEHIFMFLDLKDSTAHAERLGHLEFGSLIQDCFMDMSVVSDYSAEFYQYVGDESISRI